MDDFLTDDMRVLQEKFQTRRLADKVRERAFRTTFTSADRVLIDNAPFFFLATVDRNGRPQCSYKGGQRGFVRVTGAAEITFPIFEGNGLYLSVGNIAGTGRVDLLFIDFEKQSRLRVNGTAIIDEHHPLLGRVAAAQAFVRVHATHIHPNCPRHVHRMALVETSASTPAADHEDVGKAAWGEAYDDVLPAYMKPPRPPEGGWGEVGGRSLGRHAWKCHLRASAAPFPARRFAHDKLKAAVLACSAGHRSSMVQDMDSGRRAEIDPLNGAVARLGKAHGVANPTHDALIALIKARQPG